GFYFALSDAVGQDATVGALRGVAARHAFGIVTPTQLRDELIAAFPDRAAEVGDLWDRYIGPPGCGASRSRPGQRGWPWRNVTMRWLTTSGSSRWRKCPVPGTITSSSPAGKCGRNSSSMTMSAPITPSFVPWRYRVGTGVGWR